MWNELKKYIKSNDIQLVGDAFDLFKMFNELHHVRNLVMYGELIQKCDFYKLNTGKDNYSRAVIHNIMSWI